MQSSPEPHAPTIHDHPHVITEYVQPSRNKTRRTVIRVEGDTGTIHFPNGRVATFDAGDLDTVLAYRWGTSGSKRHPYVMASYTSNATEGAECVLLHRALMEAAGHDLTGLVVDHINRDTLDNRRANLRAVSQSANLANGRKRTSAVPNLRGVYPESGKFSAVLCHASKAVYLGFYQTAEQAAMAWDVAALSLRGSTMLHHNLNFPDLYPTYQPMVSRVQDTLAQDA